MADDLIANCVCDVCGCRGLHACMGSRPKPMTEEEHARERMALRNAFEIIFQAEEMGRMRTDHADALARKDAEIAAMQRTMDMVNTSASFHVRRAEQAEARAERAEARVREALSLLGEARNYLEGLDIADTIDALVLLDTEEAK